MNSYARQINLRAERKSTVLVVFVRTPSSPRFSDSSALVRLYRFNLPATRVHRCSCFFVLHLWSVSHI